MKTGNSGSSGVVAGATTDPPPEQALEISGAAEESAPIGSSADEVQMRMIPPTGITASSAVPVIEEDEEGAPNAKAGVGGGVEFTDHFSLRVPSSTLRFRGGGGGGGKSGSSPSSVYLYEQRSQQIQLLTSTSTGSSSSRRKDKETMGTSGDSQDYRKPGTSRTTRILVKSANTGSPGLNALRATYTIVAVFMTGFLLIFSLQIILYIFLDLTVNSGYTTNPAETQGWAFFCTLLTVPVFVYGLATAMTLAGAFVADAWGRHTLLLTIGPMNLGQAATEWTCFTVFLGIPILTICITLLMHLGNWWEVSLLVWFGCVIVFYLVFVFLVHGYEIRACLHLIRAIDFPPLDAEEKPPSIWAVLGKAILRRQHHTLCGTRREMYLVGGDVVDPNHVGASAVTIRGTREPHRVKMGLYSRYTRWLASGCRCHSQCHCGGWGSSGRRTATQLGGTFDDSSSRDSGGGDGHGNDDSGCCGKFGASFYAPLDPPVRNYTMEDVLEVTPFVTSNTWSLEKIYCSTDRNKRVMTVVRGPSALHDDQLKSSVACAVMGNALGLLLVISILIWFAMGAVVVLIVAILVLLCFIPEQRRTWSTYVMYRDVLGLGKMLDKEDVRRTGKEVARGLGLSADNEEEETKKGDEEEAAVATNEEDDVVDNHKTGDDYQEEGIYQLWETYRITQPTKWVCITCFTLAVIFLFILPLIHLFLLGNVATAILFLFIGLFSGSRFYLNAAVIVREVGSMDLFEDREYGRHRNRGILGGSDRLLHRIDERTSGERTTAKNNSGEGHGMSDDDDDSWVWRDKSRLSQIMGMITRGRGRTAWTWFFLLFVLAFFVLSIVAVGTHSTAGSDPDQPTLTPGFYYPPSDDLPYPTCRMKKGFSLPDRNASDLVDYAFLANLAYLDTSVAQQYLDEWFGEGGSTDNPDVVETFRSSQPDEASPVSYKLVTFASVPSLGVVTIRGTANAYDFFADAQIWAAAFLAQLLRFFLPLGDLFTPILDEVVSVASVIGRASLSRVSYYQETTDFVRFLQNSSDISGLTNVQVTGHSLGGGLAIITGAQTGAPTVALSGVNAMITRKSLLPPVTAHDLNTRVFNVVPDRDPVAHVDDVADLFQRIQCRSPKNDLLGCHTGLRSLCDLLYHCGTGPRPVLCQCSRLYGYPDPLPKEGTTVSFDEVCPPGEVQR